MRACPCSWSHLRADVGFQARVRVSVRVHVCVCRESGPKKAGSSSLPNFPSVMRGWQAGGEGGGEEVAARGCQ